MIFKSAINSYLASRANFGVGKNPVCVFRFTSVFEIPRLYQITRNRTMCRSVTTKAEAITTGTSDIICTTGRIFSSTTTRRSGTPFDTA